MEQAAVRALQEGNDSNARKLLEASAPDGDGSLMQGMRVCTYLCFSAWVTRRSVLCMALQVKARVLESAAASERRAHINRMLADKLEEVLQTLQ